MVQVKKIFLIVLSTMLFQHGFSAKTLMLRSFDAPGQVSRAKLEEDILIKHRLVDQVDSYLSAEIDGLLSESNPNALIISASHGIDPTFSAGSEPKNAFFFYSKDGAVRLLRDDELVAALSGRGLLNPIGDEKRALEFVFLNGCNTADLCLRLQSECGIPVVLGWDGIVPSPRALVMSFMFCRLLSLGSSYSQALSDAVESVKEICKVKDDEFNLFVSYKINEFYTQEKFERPGGYLEVSV